MIIHTHQKSKKRKLNAKQRELRDSWNELVQKYAPKKPLKIVKVMPSPAVSKPHVRENPNYPSLSSFVPGGGCTKPIHGKVYTGTAMKGIGTLHKSNAVPIFTDEEARDQANMRR